MSNQLKQFFDIQSDGNFSDEHMIQIIEERVAQMLDGDPDLLMSYLYRLDVLEEKIKAVMNQPKSLPVANGLARLIWERQKERLEYKKKFKQDPIEGWE